MMQSKYAMLKCSELDKEFQAMGFTDLAYYLVYLYRQMAGMYSVVRVDTEAETEEDVENFFGRYRATLAEFGIVGANEPAPMDYQYVVVLHCTEEDDVLLAEMSEDGISSDFLVIDKRGYSAEEYKMCRKKFMDTFHKEPNFFQNVREVSVQIARPESPTEFEKYILDAGKVPVNVSDIVEAVADVVDENTSFNLVHGIDKHLAELYARVEDKSKVGYFVPSAKAAQYSVGEMLSMLLYLEHERTLEYSTHTSDRNIYKDLTPRGKYALLECKIKFHMEYPKIALYVGENLQHLCFIEDAKPKRNSIPLFYFKMRALEEGTAKTAYAQFPLANLRIIPILKYFGFDSNDLSVCKEGNRRFSKCAAVIDKALHENKAATVLEKCVIFQREDKDDGEIYFGYCRDGLDVNVPVWISPLTSTPVDPQKVRFVASDFGNMFSMAYISDLDQQMRDPDSMISRVLENMKKCIERDVRRKYAGRGNRELQERLNEVFSFNRYTFYENPGFDRRAYLYNTGRNRIRDTFKLALDTGKVDVASICGYSNLQKEYQLHVVPRLAKVFRVQRLRELNYLSAFGGYVPGISDPLILTDSTLKGDGLIGYSSID